MFLDELPLKTTDLDYLESRLCQALNSSEKRRAMKEKDYSSDLLVRTAKLVATSNGSERKEWEKTMKCWISSSVNGSPPFADAALDVLYDSKIYLFARVVCTVNHDYATPTQVEDWKEKATSSAAKLLAEISNTQAYEKTTTVVFDGYLEMVALVLMSFTKEVQDDAWDLRCSASKQSLFLETLFRNYANILTWLRVKYHQLSLSNAYWCLSNDMETTRRYDILVCAHDRLVELLRLYGDTTSAASLESCMDNRDVFEYLTHLDSLRFDVKLPGTHHALKAEATTLLAALTSHSDEHAKELRDAYERTLNAVISTDEESLSDAKKLRKVLKKVAPHKAIGTDEESLREANKHVDQFEGKLNTAIAACKQFFDDTKELRETSEKVALNTAIAACKQILGDTKELLEASEKVIVDRFIETDKPSVTHAKKLREAFENFTQSTAIASRAQSSLSARSQTVRLLSLKQNDPEDHLSFPVCTWDAKEFYSDDQVFGLDMKTRLTGSAESLEKFSLEMTTAQVFDNVTLLFYLRNRDGSKLSSLFAQTGLWFYETSAWNVGHMLAEKYARTGNAGNMDTSTTAFLPDEAKEERCFIAFDNDIFRRFTNDMYKLGT